MAKKRTPQEVMSENVAREKALKELERAMGKPRVKGMTIEEYKAKLQSEKEQARGDWNDGSAAYFLALWGGDSNETP